MNTIQAVVGGISALALVAAVTLLTWHGSIDGQAAIGFFTGLTVAGVVGGVGHAAAKNGARAALGEMNGVVLPPERRVRRTAAPKPPKP